MSSHFLLLVLFSGFVSLVFAVLLRDDPRDQATLGLQMLAGFMVAAIVLGWLMYVVPI